MKKLELSRIFRIGQLRAFYPAYSRISQTKTDVQYLIKISSFETYFYSTNSIFDHPKKGKVN